MFLALLVFAGVDFSKMERTFLFLGFCPPSIRAVWRGFNSDSVLPKLFSFLGKGFGKTSAEFFRGGKKKGSGENEFPPRSRFQFLLFFRHIKI